MRLVGALSGVRSPETRRAIFMTLSVYGVTQQAHSSVSAAEK